MDGPARQKIGLRSAALNRRLAMTSEERIRAGRLLAAALAPAVRSAERIAAYVSTGSEPETAGLLALRDDVLLPVLLPDGDLDWAVGGTLMAAGRGLLEPTGTRLGVHAVATCDLILVPALAVDRRGARLGRGGGSYDRALARSTGLSVALLYDGEVVECLPTQPHDLPVGAVVTPSGGLRRLPAPSGGPGQPAGPAPGDRPC